LVNRSHVENDPLLLIAVVTEFLQNRKHAQPWRAGRTPSRDCHTRCQKTERKSLETIALSTPPAAQIGVSIRSKWRCRWLLVSRARSVTEKRRGPVR